MIDINSTTDKPIDVILADDHVRYRAGLKMVLDRDKRFKVVAEADNGYHLLHLLKTVHVDVILLDIQMPLMDGIEALPQIKQLYPHAKVIMISMVDERPMVAKLMGMGANSYLAKTSDPEVIYDAILTCHEKTYYNSNLVIDSIFKK